MSARDFLPTTGSVPYLFSIGSPFLKSNIKAVITLTNGINCRSTIQPEYPMSCHLRTAKERMVTRYATKNRARIVGNNTDPNTLSSTFDESMEVTPPNALTSPQTIAMNAKKNMSINTAPSKYRSRPILPLNNFPNDHDSTWWTFAAETTDVSSAGGISAMLTIYFPIGKSFINSCAIVHILPC